MVGKSSHLAHIATTTAGTIQGIKTVARTKFIPLSRWFKTIAIPKGMVSWRAKFPRAQIILFLNPCQNTDRESISP